MKDQFNPILKQTRFDIKQVRVFLHVAEELHYGKAASKLFISQPALTRSIQSLEEAVGVQLLERSTRKVKLTAAGEAFAAEARLALTHFERASFAAKGATEFNPQKVIVGYTDFAITGRLPTIFNNFHKEYPENILDLRYSPSYLQRQQLIEGKIDVAVIIGKLVSSKVTNLLIEKHDYVALIPEGHSLAKVDAVYLEDLSQEDFVMGNEETFGSFREVLFPICHARGFHPNIVQETSNTAGILGMVAAGVGISIYAGCARNLNRVGVKVKPIVDVKERISTYACWITDNFTDTQHRFHEYLKQHALPDK